MELEERDLLDVSILSAQEEERERGGPHTQRKRTFTDTTRIKEGRDHVGRQQLPRFVSVY